MKNLNRLEGIAQKYSSMNYNINNYHIGGGLDSEKFASRRHEDAKNDEGKLTFGQATQLLKKATELDTDIIKEVIEYAVPNMEWHHAGKLPKSYGGGMKKTYFLNASQIVDIATNLENYLENIALSKIAKKEAQELKKAFEIRKSSFLNENAKKVERVEDRPNFFYQTAQEMNGKYGWFDSSGKSYNMTEYFSGWKFDNKDKYQEFLNLK